jgi:hypothetical protein
VQFHMCRDFARSFSWFASTLQMMAAQEQGTPPDIARLASVGSMRSEASGLKEERPTDNGSSESHGDEAHGEANSDASKEA